MALLVSCSKPPINTSQKSSSVVSEITAEAPEETYGKGQLDSLNHKISYLTVPFDLSIAEIEKQINDNFSGLIHDDDSYEGDDLKIKIWKQDDLEFEPRGNGVFDFKVPLRVWVEKRISVFGMIQTPSTEFEIITNFSSKPFISANWELKTVTNAEGFEWVTQPKITMGGFSVPITGLVEGILTNYQSSIARLIDESVANEVDVKTPVLNTWNVLKEPFQISEEYNMWLQVVPQDILMTELQFSDQHILAAVSIKAIMNSSIGKSEISVQKSSDLPPLKFATSLPDGFGIHLYNLITFEEAEEIAKSMLLGETFEFRDDKTLEVLSLEIFGTTENKLVFQINTIGDLKGTIYLTGDPVYDSEKRAIVLRNTELDLKTKNILAKAASWLMEGKLEREIENSFGIPIDPIFEMAKISMDSLLNSELENGIKLKGQLDEITPGEVYLKQEGLMTTVEVKGRLGIRLE